MSLHHHGHSHHHHDLSAQAGTEETLRFRRALWIVLFLNGTMCGIEIMAGAHASSAALLADALDFFGDAANFAISLLVLDKAGSLRSRAALLKAFTMAVFALFVLGQTAWNAAFGVLPQPFVMGTIGLLALAANVGSALLLYRFRGGDSNRRSAWLCSRNDAIGNAAVVLAALGVFGTGRNWADLFVAAVMALLALAAALQIIRQARHEIKTLPGK